MRRQFVHACLITVFCFTTGLVTAQDPEVLSVVDLVEGRPAVLATQAATCVRNIRLASDFERALMRRTEELDARIGVLEARVEDQAKEIALLRKLEPYVAPQVVDLVLSGQVEEALRTHRGEVAVVFCDLRGFTSFSEEVEPEGNEQDSAPRTRQASVTTAARGMG